MTAMTLSRLLSQANKSVLLTVRSHTMWRIWPPPTAYPATMAITGLGKRRIWICSSRMMCLRYDDLIGNKKLFRPHTMLACRSSTLSLGTSSDPT